MRNRLVRVLGLAIILAAVALMLAAASRSGRAWLGHGRGLASLPADARVLHEPGARAHAARIAIVLDDAALLVERRQRGSFVRPPTVHVCATQESFDRRIGARPGGRARGAVFLDAVILSPRAFETSTERGILIHELSHLQLRQALGVDRVMRDVPAWFQEGLAVLVSDGAGAERVSEERALELLRAGRRMQPRDSGSRWRPRGAAAHGLPHHVFYRQAELFVRELRASSPREFERFLDDLQGGRSFRDAFEVFGTTVESRWTRFCDEAPRQGH